MPSLEDAIALAARCHAGQKSKDGVQPYILHPLAVMQIAITTWGYDLVLATVAILHDVVEDTGIGFEELEHLGYPPAVIEALQYVTKLPEEEEQPGDTADRKERRYSAFIERTKGGPLVARRVKVADLRHNKRPPTFPEKPEKTQKREARYNRALAILEPLCEK